MPTEHHSEARRQHILTVALEDYFHGPAFRETINRKVWGRLETRFERTCLELLCHLEQHHTKATFFVDPWVGRQCPKLVRLLIERGHEIALAGQRGMSFRFCTHATFRQQLRVARDEIEQACGKQVLGYRASDALLATRDLWGLEVLAAEGFLYDSSLNPFFRRFGSDDWRRFMHRTEYHGRTLWEIPLSSCRAAGVMVPVAGGNYFRQYPDFFIQWALRRLLRETSHPLVLYFRLWDFDPEHPRIHTGSAWGNLRHYRNSGRIDHVFRRLLSQYQFNSVASYLNFIQPDLCVQPAAETPITVRPVATAQRIPISVIVPCYNEQSGLKYLDNSLRDLSVTLRRNYDPEFILVDDGSRDRTWEVMQEVFGEKAEFRLLRHKRNQGVAGAIRTGLLHAREIACSMDCDCSYDPNELLPMLRLLQDGVDLVTASPYHPEGAVNNVPEWRLLLSRGASRLYRVVTGKKLHTFTSCFRVYRRSIALTVPLTRLGFLGIAELTSKLLLHDRTVVEYPATLEVRMFGQSKMKVLRTIAGHIDLLTKLLWLRIHPDPKQQRESVSLLSTEVLNTQVDGDRTELSCVTPLSYK